MALCCGSRVLAQHTAVCCSVLQYVAVCCSVLQCVAVCCSLLCRTYVWHRSLSVCLLASSCVYVGLFLRLFSDASVRLAGNGRCHMDASWHIRMSHVTYKWVVSNMNGLCHVWMPHLYSRLRVSWPRIFRLILKTLILLPGVPEFSWSLWVVLH